ncbi:MAG: hypothetical protein ACE5HP_06800 [Gemmatimonadota bacterium]
MTEIPWRLFARLLRPAWVALGGGLLSGYLAAAIAADFLAPFLFGIEAGDVAVRGAAGSILAIILTTTVLATALPAARLRPVSPPARPDFQSR